MLPVGSSTFMPSSGEEIVLVVGAFLGLVPAILAFLVSPGQLWIRMASGAASLLCLLLVSLVAWQLQIKPSEPLVLGFALVSFGSGWQLGRMLVRRKRSRESS
jgi:hypothetical protein